MRLHELVLAGWVLASAHVAAPMMQVRPPQAEAKLAEAVPEDVFLFISQRHNPERKFVDEYWAEVFEALGKSGVGQDVLDLLAGLLGGDPAAEAQRLKARADQLVAGVDWSELAGREFGFAERFEWRGSAGSSRNTILMPDMVWLMRGSPEGAERNYGGLVDILGGIAEEINRAAGSTALAVTRAERDGADVARLNLLAPLPGAPELPLSVARRGEVIVIALGDALREEVLERLAGRGVKPALATNARFRAAFAQLPPAEDSVMFFDLQGLMQPLYGVLSMALEQAGGASDIYRNAEFTAQQSKLNASALAAYQRGDVQEALALTEKLYESAPTNSIVLYNRACFSALLGRREAALDWLERAVDAGFHAPGKIESDSDLESLRSEPRYRQALARAGELADRNRAEDVVVNSSQTGEAAALILQALQAYEAREYDQGLKLSEQAYALAPKDSRVLYSLACFHALLGHKEKALEYLGAAVDGGYYCPRHIAKDPDLESLRSDPRYAAAVERAREHAAALSTAKEGDEIAWVRLALDKLFDAAGCLDYLAAVERTEGTAVWTESLAALTADARRRAIYPVLAGKPPLTTFDRFLPQETESFSVSTGLDVQALYAFLESSVRELGPAGEELLAKWAKLQQQLGVDLRKDVIGWIDGGLVSVTLADRRGSVALLKVTDEDTAREKVQAAIEFLSTGLPELVSQNPALTPLALMASLSTTPVEREDLRGFHTLQVAFLPEPAVWGVAEGHLVVASSADAAALCLATARGAHPGIRRNARVMAELIVPDAPFTSVTLTDQRRLGEELAEGIGMASMVGGMVGSFAPEPELRRVLARIVGLLGKLSPVVRKIDFYRSTASLTTFDGQAWRTRMVTHYVPPAERRPAAPPAAAPSPAPSAR